MALLMKGKCLFDLWFQPRGKKIYYLLPETRNYWASWAVYLIPNEIWFFFLMPLSRCWLLATACKFLSKISKVAYQCLLSKAEREWVAKGYLDGFVSKAGPELMVSQFLPDAFTTIPHWLFHRRHIILIY